VSSHLSRVKKLPVRRNTFYSTHSWCSYWFYLSGISILEGGSEGITMELEMNWDGNPSIILDIMTYVAVGLPVQVI